MDEEYYGDQRYEIIADFAKYAKFILGEGFELKPHHHIICNEVNECLKRAKDGVRSFEGVFMPPRHGKTLFLCDLLFTYLFGRYPDYQCLYITYSEDLASQRKSVVEKIIASEEYQWLFPDSKTRDMVEDHDDMPKSIRKSVKNTGLVLSNALSKTGKLEFAGINSSVTGKGFDIITVDDPYKNDSEARSEKINSKIKYAFESVVSTRLEKGACLFLIYTRWVSDDICGMLEEYAKTNVDPNYVPLKSFVFPAEMIGEKKWYDQREEGEPLDHERLPDYAAAKKNPDIWGALYQQQPLDVLGAMMKLEWFPRHHSNAHMSYITIVVDANYRERSLTVDKTAVSVFGTRQGKRHLIEFCLKKMDFPEQIAVISEYVRKYPRYWAVLVEEKANGDAILSSLRMKFGRCIGVDPKGKGKRERAQLVLPFLMSGHMSLPDVSICPNVGDAVTQILRFTGVGVEEDDFIDTMIYDIAYYEQYGCKDLSQTVHTIANPIMKRLLGSRPQQRVAITRSRYVGSNR